AGRHPFGEPFAEEEVVLDRYASLEADLFGRLPTVSSREGSELGKLLAAHALPPVASTLPLKPTMETDNIPAAQTFETSPQAPPANTLNDDELDADIIVVEDHPHGSTLSAPLARKQEYRQLFAKLRRG